MTEQMNVPKLRFGEFDSMLELSYFGKLVNDITYGPRFSAEDYCSDGNVRTIRGTDMGANGEIKYNQVPTAQLEGKTVNRHELKDGDLVMITTADCGVTSVYREQPIKHICSAYAVKINLNDNADSTYFKYFYQTSKAQYEVSRFIRKATVSNLPGSDINRIRHYPPSLQEQQKIASFLSKVDEKISLLTEKKDKLAEYKKGVMQQLFNGSFQEQDGLLTFTPPTLRFKADDGSEFPDWEINKLGTRTKKVGSGATPRGGEKAYSSDGVLFIRSQNVNNNKLLLDEIRFIPEHTDASMKRSRVEANDILLNITGASIGRSCVVPSDFVKGNLNQHVCIIRLVADNPHFVQSYLASYFGEKLIFQGMAGGGREGLNFESIKGFKLPFPSLAEQNKIANFLSTIDQKIDLTHSELEKAKEWKKGLLQQMFV